MPTRRILTMENAQPQMKLILPGEFRLFQSYCRRGPEVIALGCDPEDCSTEVFVLESTRLCDLSDEDALELMNDETKIDELEGEDIEPGVYPIKNSQGKMGKLVVDHLTISPN